MPPSNEDPSPQGLPENPIGDETQASNQLDGAPLKEPINGTAEPVSVGLENDENGHPQAQQTHVPEHDLEQHDSNQHDLEQHTEQSHVPGQRAELVGDGETKETSYGMGTDGVIDTEDATKVEHAAAGSADNVTNAPDGTNGAINVDTTPVSIAVTTDDVNISNENDAVNVSNDANDIIMGDADKLAPAVPSLAPRFSPGRENSPFVTPSKTLPPLKDIEQLSTPRTFDVAKDPTSSNSDEVEAVLGFLGVTSQDLMSVDPRVIHRIAMKSSQFAQMETEVHVLRVQSEQVEQRAHRHTDEMRQKLETMNETNNRLQSEVDAMREHERHVGELTQKNKGLAARLEQISSEKERLATELASSNDSRDSDIVTLTTQVSELTSANIEQAQRINELTREANTVSSELFSAKLEVTKQANTISHLHGQKEWYEAELRKVQERYTDLLKKHETQYLTISTDNAQLAAQVEGLHSQVQLVREHNKQLEAELAEKTSGAQKAVRESKREVEALLREIDSQKGLLELTQKQVDQRNKRVAQLEEYANGLRDKLAAAVAEQEADKERVIELEEKLARTEEAFGTSPEGVNLSQLHTEFYHLQKQLDVERRQKEALSAQMAQFVAELDSKKPALASYREQVREYEERIKMLVHKVEERSAERSDIEHELNRTRTQNVAVSNELAQTKQLLRDVGRQLCFFLIHANVREKDEDPLTVSEKRAIENILTRTGNDSAESEADLVVSERMLEFRSVIELRERNEELIKAVRVLTHKLEDNEDVESLAVAEAKDAILTLEGELASMDERLKMVASERDTLKEEVKRIENVASHTVQDKKEVVETIQKPQEVDTSIYEVKISMLERMLADIRGELASVNKNLVFWKEQAAKQEQMLVSKTEALRQAESTIAQSNIAQQRAQQMKELAESTLNSQKAEAMQLRADSTQLKEFVANLQALLRERDAAAQKLSERLESSFGQYEELQRRLTEKDALIERILEREREKRKETQDGEEKEKKQEKKQENTEGQEVQKGTPPNQTTNDQSLQDSLHITELLRANEEALAAANERFESYKADLESRNQTTASERDRLQTLVTDLEKQLANVNSEVQTLRAQLSTSAEEMRQDYERRLQSVTADLNAQAQLASDHQTKYQSELQRNHELSQRVSDLRDTQDQLQGEIQRLTTQINQHVATEERVYLEVSTLEEELGRVKTSLQDSRAQNALLTAQLEAGRSDDEMTQVVAYLRKEKEEVEEELRKEREKRAEEVLRKEREKRVDSVDVAPITFEKSEKTDKTLLELNILRESNSTLRREMEQYRTQATELSTKVKELESELTAIKARNESLTTELEVAQQRVRLVEETNKRLSSNSPVPEDNAAIQAMREKYNDLRAKANNKLASQNETIVKLRGSVNSLSADLEKLKEEHDAKTKESQKYVAALTQEKNQLVIELGQIKKEKQVLEEQKKEQPKEQPEGQHPQVSTLEARIAELEAELEAGSVSLKDAETKLAEAEKEIADLKQKVQTESQNTKARVEKLYEMKMKMLSKKLERLEKRDPDAPTGSSASEAFTPQSSASGSTNVATTLSAESSNPSAPASVGSVFGAVPFGTAPESNATESNAPQSQNESQNGAETQNAPESQNAVSVAPAVQKETTPESQKRPNSDAVESPAKKQKENQEEEKVVAS